MAGTTLGSLYGHRSAAPSSGSSKSLIPTNGMPASAIAPSAAEPAAAAVRQNVVLLGLRRSGKTSVLRVVHDSLSPTDTHFLESTTKAYSRTVDAFVPLCFHDGLKPVRTTESGPGGGVSSPSYGTARRSTNASSPTKPLLWNQVAAVVFVIDAQDDYFDALVSLHDTILEAHADNPDCRFHVFVNKMDAISDDYRYDTLRDIEQRVYDDLSDASARFVYSSSSASASSLPVPLETSVKLSFHLTSIYDTSIFIAFSRVQDALVPPPLADAVERVCDGLCASSALDKAFLFDIFSHTYLGSDSGPFDASAFDVATEYMHFLVNFSGLYANLHSVLTDPTSVDASGATGSTGIDDDEQGRYASSVAHLSPDTTVAFWQINASIVLIALLPTETHSRQAGMLDYNVALFRRAVQQLWNISQSPDGTKALEHLVPITIPHEGDQADADQAA